MTEKQDRILQTALRLFAQNGYDATSTSKVAREAGVSEGLIFRHFASKEGLLQAIMEIGREKAAQEFSRIAGIPDPKQALRAVIQIPFGIDPSQYDFWRLLYSIKWQATTYDDTMSAPLKLALIDIFSKLDYKNPMAEADLIMVLFDGIATEVLLKTPKDRQGIKQAILDKYGL